MHDYSIIGSYNGFYNRHLPLERMPSFDMENSIRVKEVDELKHKDETDIEFMESLYRNSNPDYYLGGWIVKAVVDILLEFTIGDLPTIQASDKKYEQFCNYFLTHNQSNLYATIKELGLFGQEFCYIGWDQELKTPRIRPMSKKQIIDIRYENFNDPSDITFVRFRDQFQQIKVINGKDKLGDEDFEYEDVYYDKFFWKEINPKYKEAMDNPLYKSSRRQPKWIYKMKIYKKVGNNEWEVFKPETNNPLGIIPIIEFNQNKLSFDKVGYSDLSGAMKIVAIYHQVLESTINNSLYNSQPTLKFTGLDSDPIDFVKRMYGDYSLQSGDVLEMNGMYDVYGAYYLSGSQDVSWLTVPTTASASKEILNILFYILVQVTGVPEWVLGAGMEGAWATVKQQSIPLLQKIRSKRMDITDDLLKLFRYAYYVAKYYLTGDENELDDVEDFTCQIIWGDVLTNDMDLTLRLVEFMLDNHFITKETAVSIIGLVNDPTGELKKAQKQWEKENKKNDNTGTIQKMMNKSLEDANLDEEEEENAEETEGDEENPKNGTEEAEEETEGEMDKQLAYRLFNLLYQTSAD